MSRHDLPQTRRYAPPGELEMTWLIGRRAAIEALQDRLSSVMLGVSFALLVPVSVVLVVIRPVAASPNAPDQAALGDVLAFYLLVVGLLPTLSAVGIASGQFAGEKERGILTPLLASPASNVAIFAGKVLGAILPPLVYALVGECVYVVTLAVVLGPPKVQLLPVWLSVTMIALVPGIACFAASAASLISSRVRTFNAAQQIGGLVLMPLWGVVFALAVKLPEWGPGAMLAMLAAVMVLDVALLTVAATTWRREEVLAQH